MENANPLNRNHDSSEQSDLNNRPIPEASDRLDDLSDAFSVEQNLEQLFPALATSTDDPTSLAEAGWEVVDFPAAIPLNNLEQRSTSISPETTAELPGSASPLSAEAALVEDEGAEEIPAENAAAVADNQATLIQELQERNAYLLQRVSQLETLLSDGENTLQLQAALCQEQAALLAQNSQELMTTQEYMTRLLTELDFANQTALRQQILIETLTGQLEGSQERVAQLERECSLLQQRHNEQTQQLLQSDSLCRDLRSRLHRQQRYTLQFKAALEKCLDMPSHRTEADVSGAGSSATVPQEAPVAGCSSAHTSFLPKVTSIQPWSAQPWLDPEQEHHDYWLETSQTASDSPTDFEDPEHTATLLGGATELQAPETAIPCAVPDALISLSHLPDDRTLAHPATDYPTLDVQPRPATPISFTVKRHSPHSAPADSPVTAAATTTDTVNPELISAEHQAEVQSEVTAIATPSTTEVETFIPSTAALPSLTLSDETELTSTESDEFASDEETATESFASLVESLEQLPSDLVESILLESLISAPEDSDTTAIAASPSNQGEIPIVDGEPSLDLVTLDLDSDDPLWQDLATLIEQTELSDSELADSEVKLEPQLEPVSSTLDPLVAASEAIATSTAEISTDSTVQPHPASEAIGSPETTVPMDIRGDSSPDFSTYSNWPSPVINPLRNQKKIKSMAAIDLPMFPRSH